MSFELNGGRLTDNSDLKKSVLICNPWSHLFACGLQGVFFCGQFLAPKTKTCIIVVHIGYQTIRLIPMI